MTKEERVDFKLTDSTTMDSVATYSDILYYLKSKQNSSEHRDFHLLLGNGFSIAYDEKIFSYNALSSFILQSNNEFIKKLFDLIGTTNLETIMLHLDIMEKIVQQMKSVSDNLLEELKEAQDSLRKEFVTALEEMHPEHVFKLTDNECTSCHAFLNDYIQSNGNIFSSNYDLLLYWVTMRNKMMNAIDGFGRENDGTPENPDYDCLSWGKHKNAQRVFYLHGALFLFDEGSHVTKAIYDGDHLLKNIKAKIDNRLYPIFVTAGSAEQKMIQITHNQYLKYCYDNLSSISGSLVTLGLSFNENDSHLIKAINAAHRKDPNTRLWSVYVGVFCEKDLNHIKSIKDKYFDKDLKVNVYNAGTAKIWR